MNVSGVTVWTLEEWPEDRLPICSSPPCEKPIRVGEMYIVIPGSIRVVCANCMRDLSQWKASIDVAAELEQDREKREIVALDQHRKERERGGLSSPRQNFSRLAVCPACENEFVSKSHGARGYQKYCSLDCAPTAKRADREATCPTCNRVFIKAARAKNKPEQKYCSKSCARLGARGQTTEAPTERPWSVKHERCLGCATTGRPHRARGLCARCYTYRYEQGLIGNGQIPRPREHLVATR